MPGKKAHVLDKLQGTRILKRAMAAVPNKRRGGMVKVLTPFKVVRASNFK